jgi:hypothetical protein
MTQFTDNVTVNVEEGTVSGTGIFDIIMNTATEHLTVQYETSRIRKEDYATAYADIFKNCLGAAVQIWIQKPVQDRQAELVDAQKLSEEAKKELYYRQIEGFDEDYLQKILKITMDSWAVGFSVARDAFEAEGIPAPMQKLTIDDLYNRFVVPEFDNYTYGRNLRKTTTNPNPQRQTGTDIFQDMEDYRLQIEVLTIQINNPDTPSDTKTRLQYIIAELNRRLTQLESDYEKAKEEQLTDTIS